MTEDSGEQEGVKIESNTLDLEGVVPGDRIFFETRSGSIYKFTVERPAERKGGSITPATGVLKGGILQTRYGMEAVQGAQIVGNGSTLKGSGIEANKLAQGASAEILLPVSVRFPLGKTISTSPVTEISVSRGES